MGGVGIESTQSFSPGLWSISQNSGKGSPHPQFVAEVSATRMALASGFFLARASGNRTTTSSFEEKPVLAVLTFECAQVTIK
jgi:hypothetical protein